MHLMRLACKRPARGLWTKGLVLLLGQPGDQATWAFARV
jgi:hypothetical protein